MVYNNPFLGLFKYKIKMIEEVVKFEGAIRIAVIIACIILTIIFLYFIKINKELDKDEEEGIPPYGID